MALTSHLPDWLRLRKEGEEDASRGLGSVTGCDLGKIACLTLPFQRDPFYRLRPAFSKEAVRLSLELAETAYRLDLEPWCDAGWKDFSIQVDNSLHSGLRFSSDGDALQALMSQMRVSLARAAISGLNPVGQLMAARRQREHSDTLKAVCMMHSTPEGQHVLAIGFMGTGKRLLDWFSNLRITTEEGFHKGFYQLCTHFEQSMEKIVFPATAKALGLENLTLAQVLQEARSLSSRFRIWMAGHSQGSAVMQVFAHRLMYHYGVLSQNMTGYGFASPTVATGRLIYDPACYPLFHILSSDDLVPKVGAVVHLGMGLEYASTPAQRESSYFSRPEEAIEQALHPLLESVADGPSAMERIWVMLTILRERTEESVSVDRKGIQALWDHAVSYAGKTAAGWLDAAIEYLEKSYQEITGQPMPSSRENFLPQMRQAAEQFPLRSLLEAAGEIALPPHSITHKGQDGAYAYLVRNGLDQLKPFIWTKEQGKLPVRRFAAQPMQESAAPLCHKSGHRALSAGVSRRERRGVRRLGYSALREK